MLVIPFLDHEIPTRSGVTFYLHRDAFIELAESAVKEFQSTGRVYRLPESPLYESADARLDLYSDVLVVEFIIDDFYLPLVYITTDNPEDVDDTCSKGGVPVDRLEPKWYVCSRDWN